MCGLVGYAFLGGVDRGDTLDEIVRHMTVRVAHRGPDGSELLLDSPVGLGFTRLSLVDPVSGGQPLVSPDASLVLIANGEVYNHAELERKYVPAGVLRTGSDCEVLLHLYRQHGLRFLDEVKGMFAIILWDRRAGRLILARDRFGIKPLYYHRDAERIAMASEIKALFSAPGVPRRLDWVKTLASPALSAAPVLGELPFNTWFEGIESVPAATILEVSLRDGAIREHRYWEFPSPDPALDASDAELVLQYRGLLVESVTDCATADTELGLFLSGGVDSATVAAIAKSTVPDLHTFSVLSPSTHLNGDARNGRAVADRLGLPNHQVVFHAGHVPSVSDWRCLVWLLENPMCGPEQFYKHELHRYAKQARPELRGMLLGAAADEFCGGYSAGYSDNGGWDDFISVLRMMSQAESKQRHPQLAWWASMNGQPLITESALGIPSDVYPEYLRWEWAKIQQYNCWHEDRTAAGSGIEARVPFLDHRLVELAASLPEHRRRTLLWDKKLIREVARPLLPTEITERTKVPFYEGDGRSYTYRSFTRMLAQEGAALVEEALSAPDAEHFLDADVIRAELGAALHRPDGARLELLLRLTNVGLLAAMAEQQPRPPGQTRAELAPPPPDVRDWLGIDTVSDRRLGSELGCHEFEPGTRLALADGVQLLAAPLEADRFYLAVNGTVEYEFDDSMPIWLSVFKSMTGEVTVSSLNAGLDVAEDKLALVLTEAIDLGLIAVVTEQR